MKDIFGNEVLLQYTKILRQGAQNTSILLPDGTRQKIPTSQLSQWTCLTPSQPSVSRSSSVPTTSARKSHTENYGRNSNGFGLESPFILVSYDPDDYGYLDNEPIPFV